jgi:hypothetical protein
MLLAAAGCWIVFLTGCGNDGGNADSSGEGRATGTAGEEVAMMTALDSVALAKSLERAATEFLQRTDTTVSNTMDRELRGRAELTPVRGSAECREGRSTAAVTDSERYPYACILTVNAIATGLSTQVILGFVVTSTRGECWAAQNERLGARGGVPVLYPRHIAKAAENRIRGCVAT